VTGIDPRPEAPHVHAGPCSREDPRLPSLTDPPANPAAGAAADTDAGAVLTDALAIRLAVGISRGEPAAVEAFYRCCFPLLLREARRATRGRDESFCLDVVQDAVLRVIRAVRPVTSRAQFLAWLRLVVRATAYDLLRAQRSRTRHETAAAASATAPIKSSNGDAAPDADQLAWLRRTIARLDPQLADMIDRRYQQRWTLTRIAAALGLSVATVDGRLRRALSYLRDLAREEFHE
jgi:RNA polymerase sigma-70 factor (ECF subfamily)